MYNKKITLGYYKVNACYEKRLEYAPYSSAGVNVSDDGVVLVSYATPVIYLYNDGWLICTGTYSATTIKHIIAFMREYGNGLGYQDAKNAYLSKYAINIYTGEIKSLDTLYNK